MCRCTTAVPVIVPRAGTKLQPLCAFIKLNIITASGGSSPARGRSGIMFRQHTPRMHPHIHMPKHLLRWLGLGALAIVVAVSAMLFVRTPPAIAPEPSAPQPVVNHPYDSSAYVRYLTERPALAWSLEYGPRF